VKPNALFGDKKVRQALAYAVNMDKIIQDILTSETGEAYARPAIGTITPSMCNAYNDQVKPFGFDPAKAKQLLAEAGWTDTDGDGIVDKDGKKFSFTLTTNAGNARRNKASIIIQAMLKDIGVEAKLEQIEGNTFFERLRKKDFEASLSGWSASLILDLTDLWHSGSQYQFNFTSYANPDVDALIEKGMNEPDPAKSAEMWKELQAKIYEDQPYLFLYWWDDSVAVHKRFREASPDLLSAMSEYWKWWVPADEVKYPN
jgi:peptide/nickel transport system substrate-binding protein